jgi:hypothetical protein
MDTAKRKALRTAYQDQPVVGGVYCITCEGNHRRWVKPTVNLPGQQNRFAFAIATQSCPEPAMREEWLQYGAQSFTFTVLDQLQKKETQTDDAFWEDIGVLLAFQLEKENTHG